MAFEDNKLRIIPLGGVTEIGKNMTCFCYRDEILVVDAGLMFPEEDMPGVDIVIPDMTFLEERADEVLGLVLTHGHEDHVGAIPYLLREMDIPIYGTALTVAIVRNKLEEHKLADVAKLNEVDYGDVIELGSFSVEYFRVSHSIPGAAGLIIRTPIGNI
ncbi:MAG: ribonuclease J, partial [Abditibacteriota bacterium]|nr:ribonuclease J [Abditibacteriota bacterium]